MTKLIQNFWKVHKFFYMPLTINTTAAYYIAEMHKLH